MVDLKEDEMKRTMTKYLWKSISGTEIRAWLEVTIISVRK